MSLEEMIGVLEARNDKEARSILASLIDHVRLIHAVEARLERLEARRGIAPRRGIAAKAKASKRDLSGYVDGRAVGGVDLGCLPCALYAKLGGKL